jgi:glycosyltransferase involved in cell wall biosynthesis
MVRVSAIVSLYNSLEFVRGCLEDLVEQTLFKRGQLEIVIIDSNSPQEEFNIVEPYLRKFPGLIVYERTAARETLYQAWNRALRVARGEYITNANSDDRHHPEALEIMSRALDRHPEIALVYADVFESAVANETFFENSRKSRYSYPTYFSPGSLLFYQFGCQPMWRASVHTRVGDFSSELRAAGDWDFCIRFSLAGLRALHIPQPLGCFLNRPTSISTQDSTSTREQAMIKERYLSLDNIILLYHKEGWRVDTPQTKAHAFTDFAVRASSMALPWTPGRIYQEPSATVLSCLAAFEMVKDDPRIAWNLGVALFRTAHRKEATQFLEMGRALNNQDISRALACVHRGEPVNLPMFGAPAE